MIWTFWAPSTPQRRLPTSHLGGTLEPKCAFANANSAFNFVFARTLERCRVYSGPRRRFKKTKKSIKIRGPELEESILAIGTRIFSQVFNLLFYLRCCEQIVRRIFRHFPSKKRHKYWWLPTRHAIFHRRFLRFSCCLKTNLVCVCFGISFRVGELESSTFCSPKWTSFQGSW